jgi:hypothetical protein
VGKHVNNVRASAGMGDAEEDRTQVRPNLHIHSGSSGLNAKGLWETVERTLGFMIRSQ